MNMLCEFKPELDAWIDEEIEALFHRADGDGDKILGKVEMKRIEQATSERGFHFPFRLKNFDTNGSGDIDLNEFTAAIRMALRETDMSVVTLCENKIRAQGVFANACLITDYWSQEELVPILLEIGVKLGDDDDEGWSTPQLAREELERYKRHDSNGDGYLDSEEFERLFHILLGKVYLLPRTGAEPTSPKSPKPKKVQKNGSGVSSEQSSKTKLR